VRKARRAAKRRGRKLRIMFADEARFGRMNRPRPCWAPIGTRPEVAAQLIREYIYLYGAVAPKDGTCVYLIMPTSNTECFEAFLDVLARKFAWQDMPPVLDDPTIAPATLPFPTTSRSCIFRPTRRTSIRRRISGTKSARKSSRTMRSNPSTPCASNSSRPSSTSSARQTRAIHHLFPIYRQLTLISRWYETSRNLR